jgi:hypothetical protein
MGMLRTNYEGCLTSWVPFGAVQVFTIYLAAISGSRRVAVAEESLSPGGFQKPHAPVTIAGHCGCSSMVEL